MSAGEVRRHCAWFGCTAVATATYTFDSSSCTVWLDTPQEGAARAGELCQRHARSLKPPRGWRVEDRRMPVAIQPTSAAVPAIVGGERGSVAELRTMLDAHSPLLARAFRSSGAL